METKSLTLNDITFPIKSTGVFAKLNGGSNGWLRIRGKNALINTESNLPVSVVSDGYEIITNEEAYRYGILCFKTLFDLKTNESIKIFNIISPKTLSYCHIDLISDKRDLTILTKDDYFPFVRITNSYNTMFKLSFRIGFCRSICINGVIFDEDSIQFDFTHDRGSVKKIDFKLRSNEFENVLERFKSDVQILSQNDLPEEFAFKLFCKAIDFKVDLNIDDEAKKLHEIEKLNKAREYFNARIVMYKKQVGNNFYAMYNVLTELGTRGFDEEKGTVSKINGRQRKAGIWLKDISGLLRNGKIDYNEYLKDYIEQPV